MIAGDCGRMRDIAGDCGRLREIAGIRRYCGELGEIAWNWERLR